MWIYVKYGFVQKLQVVNNTRQILCFLREKKIHVFSTFIMVNLTVSSEDEKFRFCVRILCSLLCSQKTNTVSVFSSSELWPGYEKAWEMPPLQWNTKTAWGGKSKAKSVFTYFLPVQRLFSYAKENVRDFFLSKTPQGCGHDKQSKSRESTVRSCEIRSTNKMIFTVSSSIVFWSCHAKFFLIYFFSPSVLSSLQVNLKMHHPFSLFSRHIVSVLFFKFWKIVQ